MDIKFFPTQYEALTTEGNEVFFGGAVGGGKSFLLRYAAILFALYIPGLQVVLVRRRYRDLNLNHLHGPEGLLAILEPFTKAGLCKINLSDLRVDFPHPGDKTSQIHLKHYQHEKDYVGFQGQEIHLLLIDELTHLTEKMYTYLLTRLRLGSFEIDYEEVRKHLPFVYDDFFPRILAGSNPGSIGARFVKRRWIDPAPPKKVWKAPAAEGGMNRVFIPSKITDNVYIMKEDPGYINRVRAVGGATADALLNGKWDITEGAALGDIWDEDIHVIPPLKIPDNATIYRSMDWGTFHPSVVLYTMETAGEELETVTGEKLIFPPRSLIVIHEIYNWDGQDENAGNRLPATEVGRQMADFEAAVPWRDNIRVGPADVQIFQQRGGSHVTIDDLLREGYNARMQEIARNDSTYKWRYDAHVLFEKADQSSGSRVTGLGLMRDFMQGSIDYFHKGEEWRGLYFVNTARHCIATIPDLPRSETKPEDVETKDVPDHAYDAIRYMVMSQAGEFQQLEVRGL